MRKDTINVVGEVYSNLTIVEMLPPKKLGSYYYKQVLCKCSCGEFKEFTYKYLKRGDTKSCGCYSQKKNVVDKIWGNWVYKEEGVPYIDKTGGFVRTIKVECVCGKTKDITLNSLESGATKSCGCSRKKAIKSCKLEKYNPYLDTDREWKDLLNTELFMVSSLGDVFNKKLQRIVKKERVSKSGKFCNQLYKTFFGEFDTQDFRVVFIDGDTKNLKIDNLFLAKITDDNNTWVSRLKSNMNTCSISRGHDKSEILIKDIINKYNEQKGLSFFLKIPLDLTMRDKLRAISIDRIDNSKPYTKENFNLVTRFENMGRGSNSFEEMLNLSRII